MLRPGEQLDQVTPSTQSAGRSGEHTFLEEGKDWGEACCAPCVLSPSIKSASQRRTRATGRQFVLLDAPKAFASPQRLCLLCGQAPGTSAATSYLWMDFWAPGSPPRRVGLPKAGFLCWRPGPGPAVVMPKWMAQSRCDF